MRDPFAPINVVSVTDPAVRFESDAARREYERTRDPSLWRPVDGRAAALFRVQPLSAEAAVKLAALDSLTASIVAFRLCVHSVTLPNGDVMTAQTEHRWQWQCAMASEDWIPNVTKAVGPRRVQEIASAAISMSMLDDDDPLSQPPGQPPQS
jgi:hypothetical protein